MSPTTIDDISLCFRGLANPLRLRIMAALASKPMCVQELEDATQSGFTQSAVSHALAWLIRHKLVTYEANGKQHVYSVNKELIDQMKDWLALIGER